MKRPGDMFRRLKRFVRGGRIRIFFALVMMLGASVLFWASRDYSVIAPDWDGQVRGIAYNPSHIFTDAEQKTVTPGTY